MESAFHLLSLELGDEEEQLERAVEVVEGVMPGETVFFPESLAWTASGSGRAFARLIALAQARDVNIVTTLNLAGDLIEDLPGGSEGERYDAVAIFTRHGAVHVPQAKVTPQAYEMDTALDGPGITISPYKRWNRVQLDWDEQLLDARFLVSSDVGLLSRFSPRELACDLLICLGGFPAGAEQHAMRILGQALEAGVARTAMLVNAHEAEAPRTRPLSVRAEEVLDATRRRKPARTWPRPLAIRRSVHLYDDARARTFATLARLPARKGRVPIARSLRDTPLALGLYPVTVVF